MDRDAFFSTISDVREATANSCVNVIHKKLDKLIKIVTKGDDIMSEQESLQEDVAKIIKRIKRAKENETLKEKADSLIEKIKSEL